MDQMLQVMRRDELLILGSLRRKRSRCVSWDTATLWIISSRFHLLLSVLSCEQK